MWPLVVAQVAGAMYSSHQAKKAAREQRAGVESQARHGAEAARLNLAHQKEMNAKNAALQREFAQSGIQWKVADAKKAGLHPLAALGAQTASASPSYQAGDPGAAERVRGNAAAQSGFINAQARISVAQQMATMMNSLAQAKYYDSLAKKNTVKVDPNQQYPIVGSIDDEYVDPGVPLNEPVGTQRTHNLNMASDMQNWEDFLGDIGSVPIQIMKLGYEGTGWLNNKYEAYKQKQRFPGYDPNWRNKSPSYRRRYK